MNFADSSAAFFDELESIEDEKLKNKEKSMDQRTDSPFSSMLTQDEEPMGDGNPASLEMTEPMVVSRAGA